LKEKRRVGLITVDTYRIAAVEQLRTYADIIDLPMQVVSTPREMREAVGRMENLDLILLDTAGRSPKDEVRIQELRAFLTSVILRPARPNNLVHWLRTHLGEHHHNDGPAVITKREPRPAAKPTGK